MLYCIILDPFQRRTMRKFDLLMIGAVERLAVASFVLALLWLTVSWAMA